MPTHYCGMLSQLIVTLFDLSSNLNANQSCIVAAPGNVARSWGCYLEHTHIVLDDTLEGAPSERGPPATEFRVWRRIRAFVERLDDEGSSRSLQGVRAFTIDSRGTGNSTCIRAAGSSNG
jgi:hypothetical protein